MLITAVLIKQYSYNSTDDVYYEFVGWYLNTGSKVYNPLNYGTEASYTIASRSMGSNANFIARYKAVEYDVEDADASARRLIVSHDLYSKTKNTNPTPHNGDGTPYVKVEILNSSDEVIKTYNNTQGAITVNSGSSDNYLRDSYKVRVTLTTETSDSNTSLVTNGIYRKNESSYLSYADTNNKDSLGTIGTLSTTNGTSSNTYSITYTYAMSDLFGSTEYGLKTLDYFTDLYTISNITINFKYFDRNTSNHSAPITMSETPTTISISAKMWLFRMKFIRIR